MHIPLFLAAAQAVEAAAIAPDYTAYVDEAAQKSGISTAVIRAVMSTESTGNGRATSPKGAMGLMQLMPGTWQDLRRQFSLGDNPFDPHDNILAGALYLRALYDAYGPDGFLAAYNAGPGRWENHRDTGQALPAETRAYVVTVTQKLGPNVLTGQPSTIQAKRPSWMEAGVFVPISATDANAPTVFVSGPAPFVSLSEPTPEPQGDTNH